MKALAPYTFRTGAIVDGEYVNGNLKRGAKDINRNLSRRYTYCPPIVIPMDGVTDALGSVLRSIKFDRPVSTNPIEIIKVEFYVYAASGVTWTLSCTDTSWSSISLATAGATTEARAQSSTVIAVPNGGVTFTVAGSAAGTITRGWIVLHCRADRGVQGSSPNHAGYTPTLVDATSSSAGSLLDTELTALAAAVTNDSTNNKDLRCQAFVARNFTATQSWNLPSGAGMSGLAYRAYIAATAADAYTTSGSVTGATLTGTGTTNLVETTNNVTSTSDDPLTTASDFTLTLGTVLGTVELAYVLVWWS